MGGLNDAKKYADGGIVAPAGMAAAVDPDAILAKLQSALARLEAPEQKWMDPASMLMGVAAGFGAPTKSGSFFESLSNANAQALPAIDAARKARTARDVAGVQGAGTLAGLASQMPVLRAQAEGLNLANKLTNRNIKFYESLGNENPGVTMGGKGTHGGVPVAKAPGPLASLSPEAEAVPPDGMGAPALASGPAAPAGGETTNTLEISLPPRASVKTDTFVPVPAESAGNLNRLMRIVQLGQSTGAPEGMKAADAAWKAIQGISGPGWIYVPERQGFVAVGDKDLGYVKDKKVIEVDEELRRTRGEKKISLEMDPKIEGAKTDATEKAKSKYELIQGWDEKGNAYSLTKAEYLDKAKNGQFILPADEKSKAQVLQFSKELPPAFAKQLELAYAEKLKAAEVRGTESEKSKVEMFDAYDDDGNVYRVTRDEWLKNAKGGKLLIPGMAGHDILLSSGLPEYQRIINKEYAETRAKAPEDILAADKLTTRLRGMADVLSKLQTGKFAETKAEVGRILLAMGIDRDSVVKSLGDPALVQRLAKDTTNSAFEQIREVTSRPAQMEIQWLMQANANAGMEPEANKAIIGATLSIVEWDRGFKEKLVRENTPPGKYAQALLDYRKENPLPDYRKNLMEKLPLFRGEVKPTTVSTGSLTSNPDGSMTWTPGK